ncbi:hypothetical protein DBB36_12880 [Flavobacterium sp. WLB]|uniref:hypothetical protein n=1 Tax=unclassified Flavobacterium TaxID=196869 RepID=UPI0006ABA09D|nr:MULTISPECIES: hypothetical protein [unclassified Flavobacterium]KOP38445.1 hypothetical protein AKO67_09585 [Flavobacterium sp. VMW]OWU89945.1 hypothetical protein APR43_14635 [Flavobacterium sp. NLM]PUU69587.1 hypothetical protein DBB36_12880 [Flavobacterium sp. WLB]
MAVKKSVLEKMSDAELEKYIKPQTTFVPEATKIAFEILKKRGHQFSEKEIDSINLLINKKEEKKIRPIHENHIKSSNFIFFSIAIGAINLLLAMKYAETKTEFISSIVAFIFVAILGYLVRKGYNLKVFLLVMFSIGLLGSIPSLISDLTYFPLNGILSLSQTILQLWAIIFLFMIPKEFESIKNNEFELWLSGKNEED